MEQFYNILKESLNEEMGWMIDHIYEDYNLMILYKFLQFLENLFASPAINY